MAAGKETETESIPKIQERVFYRKPKAIVKLLVTPTAYMVKSDSITFSSSSWGA